VKAVDLKRPGALLAVDLTEAGSQAQAKNNLSRAQCAWVQVPHLGSR